MMPGAPGSSGMAKRLYWLAALVGVIGLAALACNTPTIPIPPLRSPMFANVAADEWTASGGGASNAAQVFLINHATGDGVVVRADAGGGYVTPPFRGRMGDVIELFYRVSGGQYSPSSC